MSEVIPVNELRASAERSGSLTYALGSHDLYKEDWVDYVHKSEVNICVVGNGTNELVIKEIPLLSDKDVSAWRNDSRSAKYVHIGALTFSLELLAHQEFSRLHGSKYKGYLAILDPTFTNWEESLMSLMSFSLDQRVSQLVYYPDHCLSLTDKNLTKRLSAILIFEGPPMKTGNEIMNIVFGTVCSTVNTLDASKKPGARISAVTNATSHPLETIKSPELKMSLENGHQLLHGGNSGLGTIDTSRLSSHRPVSKAWKQPMRWLRDSTDRRRPVERRHVVTENHPNYQPTLNRAHSTSSIPRGLPGRVYEPLDKKTDEPEPARSSVSSSVSSVNVTPWPGVAGSNPLDDRVDKWRDGGLYPPPV